MNSANRNPKPGPVLRSLGSAGCVFAAAFCLLLAACGPKPARPADWKKGFLTVDGEAFDPVPGENQLVMVFWSPWAQPCMMLLRDIARLADRVQVVAVMLDAWQPEVDRLTAGDLPVIVPVDDTALDRYRIELLPTVLLLDRQGRIETRFEGYSPDLVEDIARALAGDKAAGEG